jgi:hypothetical protein
MRSRRRLEEDVGLVVLRLLVRRRRARYWRRPSSEMEGRGREL